MDGALTRFEFRTRFRKVIAYSAASFPTDPAHLVEIAPPAADGDEATSDHCRCDDQRWHARKFETRGRRTPASVLSDEPVTWAHFDEVDRKRLPREHLVKGALTLVSKLSRDRYVGAESRPMLRLHDCRSLGRRATPAPATHSTSDGGPLGHSCVLTRRSRRALLCSNEPSDSCGNGRSTFTLARRGPDPVRLAARLAGVLQSEREQCARTAPGPDSTRVSVTECRRAPPGDPG